MDPALRELLTAVGDEAGDDEVEAIIRLDRPHDDVAGVRIVARFGHVATCRIRRDRVLATWQDANVVSLKRPRPLGPEPVTDGDLPVHALDRDERRPANLAPAGAGVVVGVVDWGCDVDHPNFQHADGSTRLLALWDQRGAGSEASPQPYGYGTAWDRLQLDAALRTGEPYAALGYHPADADRNGRGAHGTHVLDIAAGSGRAGGPVGMAPEADLVFVHLAERGARGLATLGDSARILEAVDFISRVAGSRPWVINLSVGRCGGPHDGTTLAELALDHLVQEAPGRFIVQSAGNYYDRATHASGRVMRGGRHALTFVVDPDDLTPNELEVWYPGADELTIALSSPTGATTPWIPLGVESDVVSDGTVVGRLYHRRGDPNNGDHHVDLFLSPSAPPGAWELTLQAVAVVDGTFHAWLERDEACGRCQARFVTDDVDRHGTTGTIANGREPFVVAAYDGHEPTRPVAPFSSDGPTRDGRPKPDGAAPGVEVLAARSAPAGSRRSPGLLTRKSGTSMAAPHVTGAVALCLAEAPRPLAAAEVRELLARTLDPPPAGLSRLGGGYLDVARLVAAASSMNRKEPAMTASHEPAVPALVRPENLYRHLVRRRDAAITPAIGQSYVVVALPGEAPRAAPDRGDVLVRVACGERGSGHVAVLTSADLVPWPALAGSAIPGEREGPGSYAPVVEDGPFPHRESDGFVRRVLDRHGRMPRGQLLLRPTGALPDAAGGAGEEAAPSGPCAQARTNARGNDAASTQLVTALLRPIAADDVTRIAQRVDELTRLFTSLDPIARAALRRRLNDPADDLARLFDCELHHETRRRLRALLAGPTPTPTPTPTPIPTPPSPCRRREHGAITLLQPWERKLLALMNGVDESIFAGMTLITGPLLVPGVHGQLPRMIVPTVLAQPNILAITIGNEVWFREPLDTTDTSRKTSSQRGLALLVHESVHVVDYDRIGIEAFLGTYIASGMTADFDHGAIPHEQRANAVEEATFGLMRQFPALEALINACDNDAIVADLTARRTVYETAIAGLR